MMKTRKAIQILLLLITLPLLGLPQQSYFSKIYNPFNTKAIGRHILVTDSGYIAGGVGVSGITNTKTLILLKIDANGMLDSLITPITDSIKYYPGASGSLFKTNEGGYAWIGQIETSIKAYSFLIKFDSLLNLLWKKDYMLNGDTVYSFLCMLHGNQTSDGEFILVGEVDGPGQYDTNILLIKADSIGNEKWRKTYNFIGADCGWNIIQTPDKGFLIGAGGYIAGLAKSYNGLVIKTDSLGNEQWRRSFGGSLDDDKCVVANHPDGSLIVATSFCVYDPNPNAHDDYGYKTIHVIKLSQTNQVIWDKQYDSLRFWRSISNMTIDTQGMIYVLGKWWGEANDEIQVSTLLKLNSNGDSIWLREYSHLTSADAANALYDIKQTTDGGFIMCGQTDAPLAPYQSSHIWVLKVDSFGCDTPGCHTIGINTSTPLSVRDIIVFPNPASYEITLDFGKAVQDDGFVEIYNITGVLVKKEKLKPYERDYKLDVKSLNNGLYLGKIVQSDGFVRSFKFVVE